MKKIFLLILILLSNVSADSFSDSFILEDTPKEKKEKKAFKKLGIVLDYWGDVFVSSKYNTENNIISNGTLIETEDGIMKIELMDKSILIIMENSKVLFNKTIKHIAGKVYWEIKKDRKIKLPFIENIEAENVKFSTEADKEFGIIKVRENFITINKSNNFLDNILMEEYEMVVWEKREDIKFQNIELYLDKTGFEKADYYLKFGEEKDSKISKALEEYLQGLES